MADLRRMHLTISKGMKLSCTVENASEDVIVVSLKHKTKEFRGVLVDASERRLPPGLCFSQETSLVKSEGEKEDHSKIEKPEQPQIKDVRGVTLDCRYSYKYDPAKYNEQPLPATSAISIRPLRGKQVRNIRLRPRQTLCSKCKAAIHDSKSKSPSKNQKLEGEGQEPEAHPHNTRFRAAQSGKPLDAASAAAAAAAAAGPTLRSGLRNKRADSTPKVLLENIRPKRDVKPTPKKKDADAQAQRKLAESAARRNAASEEQSSDSSSARSDLVMKHSDRLHFGKRDDEGNRFMMERSVSLDNPSALSQYNKQPVVRLDKTAVNNLNYRPEMKEEKQEKAPTISIVNIRSTPAIKISYGGAGDRDVVKIPPRLPGTELKSPEGHSTADESPAPISPLPPPSPPLKKTKKASRRTRDKQRYRIVNEGDSAAELSAQGIKIVGHHRKHKRKHRHRHASSEDENFNSEVGVPPPAKLPAIIAKISVPPINDMNGNEKKSDSEVLKDSSNETPTHQDEIGDTVSKSPQEFTEVQGQVRPRRDGASGFSFDNDPLSLQAETVKVGTGSKSPTCVSNKPSDSFKAEVSDRSSPQSLDPKPFEMWGSPDKIEAPTFDIDSSPPGIEAPAFQSDDSQEGLIIGPLRLGSSPLKDDDQYSQDSFSITPPPGREDREDGRDMEEDEEEEKKESVPYGVGVFEDLTPDEDEDDHEDNGVSQPIYQVPVVKKPRMMYGGWASDNLSPAPQVPSYLAKKSAVVLSDSYSGRSRIYQNGPTSYFAAPSPSSASMYPPNPPGVFPNSPAPRIQNSPTPIIQKSPVPIFNYHSSRYQGSPNRRFGSSPSRRYHSVGENAPTRSQSLIEGNVRHSSNSSLSRYQSHSGDSEQFSTTRDRHSSSSSSSGQFVSQGTESDVTHQTSRIHTSGKFENRPNIRYQSRTNDKSGTGIRFAAPEGRSSVSRLSAVEDSHAHSPSPVLGSKPYRPGEGSSTLHYTSPAADTLAAAPRFAIPIDNNALGSQYTTGQSGSSSGSLQCFTSLPGKESGLSNQYPSLGSSDSRYQSHSETHYKLPNSANLPSPVSPSPLALQTNSRNTPSLGSTELFPRPTTDKDRVPGALFSGPQEKDRKNSSSTGPCYETVDTSALFMTHNLSHNPVPASDSSAVPNYLGKPLLSQPVSSSQATVSRVPCTEQSQKSSSLFPVTKGQSVASVSFLRQDPSKLFAGGNVGVGGVSLGGVSQGVVFHGAGSNISSSNVSGQARHPSSSSLMQPSHLPTVLLSDSEDEDSTAVPGVMPSAASVLGAGRGMEDTASARGISSLMKVHSQSVNSVMTEEGREVRVGDVMWGKVTGFPWWPCCVKSIKMAHHDHREQDLVVTQLCHVSWYGSSTVSDLSPSELRPFREEFSRRHIKKKQGPYQLAIQQAINATELTILSPLDASSRGPHPQQSLSFGLMHDLVS